jgi:dTDP-4-dehydrorhamnose reductase
MAPSQHFRAPEKIESVLDLEILLSEPTPGVIESLARLDGDVLVLGAGGKMGPTLARMARRASDQAGIRRRVIGVSRFTAPGMEAQFHQHGIETIACDLSKPDQVEKLPDVNNVIFMTGRKFDSTGNEAATWLMNVYVPGLISQQFSQSRIVALSTGNVYGLSPVVYGGSLETDALRPVGEYAMSTVGRERIFEFFSGALQMPMALLRLNYANELRYGVLVDIARSVKNGQPIDLAMGAFNAIWQADANAMILQAFDHVKSTPCVLNIAGPELLSVRRVAEEFAGLFGRQAIFQGMEACDALLSNGQRAQRLFGYPRIGAKQMIEWIADWIGRGGECLDRPTHFEVREGSF